MAKKKRKKKSKGVTALLTILIILCAGIMAYSAYRLISTALEYRKSANEYNDLRQYTTAISGPSNAAEAVIVEEEEEEETFYVPPCPLEVDWDSLKAINEDIVGWIYVGALDISYPVVRGKDNDYYLHRTFERNYLFSGSIFMEWQNNADFSDPNTIIYGHNMLDGSMFGKLKKLTTEQLYKNDPYFWILTPKEDYCYKMFSVHIATTDSEVYTLFKGTDEKFVEWAEEMRRRSEVEIDLENYTFQEDSHIATLSTCTADNGNTRYVVLGLRLN